MCAAEQCAVSFPEICLHGLQRRAEVENRRAEVENCRAEVENCRAEALPVGISGEQDCLFHPVIIEGFGTVHCKIADFAHFACHQGNQVEGPIVLWPLTCCCQPFKRLLDNVRDQNDHNTYIFIQFPSKVCLIQTAVSVDVASHHEAES